MDTHLRDRIMHVQRIAVDPVDERGHPHPGQKWKHGWIPVAASGPFSRRDFDKRLKGAAADGKARRAVASTDQFVASGPDGYGEHHKDTVIKPPDVGNYQIYGEMLNGLLREGRTDKLDRTPGSEWSSAPQALNAAFGALFGHPKTALPKDIKVHRGVPDPHRLFGGEWRDGGGNEGLTWHDPGYVSTSIDPLTADGFAKDPHHGDQPLVMTILTPKGTRAVRLGRHGSSATYNVEDEVILNSGLSFVIVNDYGRGADGVHRVDVGVLP